MEKVKFFCGCIMVSFIGIALLERKRKLQIPKKDYEIGSENTIDIENDATDSEMKKICNEQEALSLVKIKIGDNNGDWVWKCLWSDDDKFFVKAVSKIALEKGAMTGTAYSLYVNRNGNIEEIPLN